MPLINEILAPMNFEAIRDRIASIVKSELLNQSVLQNLPKLNANVFAERLVPINYTEMPAINCMLAKGNYDELVALSKDGNYQFNIDIYTCSETIGLIRADFQSVKDCQQLAGLIFKILMHWKYRRLNFAPPLIEHTEINEIKFADPDQRNETMSVMMARIIFLVRSNETIAPLTNATVIDGNLTSVKINDTNVGFVYDAI
jgi:hypothetical protein